MLSVLSIALAVMMAIIGYLLKDKILYTVGLVIMCVCVCLFLLVLTGCLLRWRLSQSLKVMYLLT